MPINESLRQVIHETCNGQTASCTNYDPHDVFTEGLSESVLNMIHAHCSGASAYNQRLSPTQILQMWARFVHKGLSGCRMLEYSGMLAVARRQRKKQFSGVK
jgi:hypothetical protein